MIINLSRSSRVVLSRLSKSEVDIRGDGVKRLRDMANARFWLSLLHSHASPGW